MNDKIIVRPKAHIETSDKLAVRRWWRNYLHRRRWSFISIYEEDLHAAITQDPIARKLNPIWLKQQ